MYYDTPRDFIGGVYEQLLYDDQPLGWDIIGRKETVRGASRDTFTSYVDRWYKPSRMVVGIGGKVGDGLHERIEELLKANRRERSDVELAVSPYTKPIKTDDLKRYRDAGADEVALVVDVPPTEGEMVKRLEQLARDFVEPAAKL